MPWEHGPLLPGGCHERVEAKWSRCTKTIESWKRPGKTCADVRWWEAQLGEGLLTGGEPAGGNESRGERGLGEAMQCVMGE